MNNNQSFQSFSLYIFTEDDGTTINNEGSREF